MGIFDIVKDVATATTQGTPVGWGIDAYNVLKGSGGGGGEKKKPQGPAPDNTPTNPISHIKGDKRSSYDMLTDAFKQYGIDPQNPGSASQQQWAKFSMEQPYWSQQATQAGLAPSQLKKAIDPLTMQTLFNQTIAPYLDKVSGQMNQTADQLGKQVGGMLNTQPMPEEARGFMKAQLPQEQAAIKQLAGAQAGAAAAGPAYDALMQQLQQGSAATQSQIGALSKIAGLGSSLNSLQTGPGSALTSQLSQAPVAQQQQALNQMVNQLLQGNPGGG